MVYCTGVTLGGENEASYHLVIANQNLANDRLLEQFNTGLERLFQKGRYKEIWSRVKLPGSALSRK